MPRVIGCPRTRSRVLHAGVVRLALVATLGYLPGVGARAEGPPKAPPGQDPAALEFFEKEVRPLLANRCQQCHGDSKQKGELRLDSREAMLTGGTTGPAVVPGKPAESLLVDAINYGDVYQMPPKSKLPAPEIATLTRWVEMGAPWPQQTSAKSATSGKGFDLKERAKHWSFQPIKPGVLPAVKASDWPRSPIDNFLLATLESRGLTPAPETDKRTLIRRVTFDLTGLPPTPAEIDAFLADASPTAYESLVERLLASPRYGERWARHWLDLVRYAETAGHEFDPDALDAFRYRDYVIRAFNADLPYDQFVTEQVAGDLLEHPRRNPAEGFNESILGTGFFFLGEGTHSPVDLREDEATRVDNQIDVFSKAFLGLTVACARCHDHKFDAISTKDYYALYGYFQSSRHQHAFIDDPARIGGKVAELRSLKEAVRSLINVPVASASHTAPGSDASSVLFEGFESPTYRDWTVSGDAFGQGPTRQGDFLLKQDGSRWLATPVPPGQAHSGLVSDRLQGVLRSRTFTIEKKLVHYLASGRGGCLNLIIDGFEKICYPIYGGLATEVNDDRPRWYTQDVSMWIGHNAYIEIADGAVALYAGAAAHYGDGSKSFAVDEIRFSDRPAASQAVAVPLPIELATGNNPVLAATLERYREVDAKVPAPNLALAIIDGTGEDERVHIRGSSKNLGDVVPRRLLEALAGSSQPAPAQGSGRLELAERMVDPSNPLLTRVIVNRVWKHHFGRGIVPTVDDFGLMGEAPTSPGLLDYLATRFVADGWSIKSLHRLLVLSSAYRMSSRPVPQSEAVDPANHLLHRMNVKRLEAEAIRDSLLAASGRLDPKLFGPSIPAHLSPFMDGRGRPKTSGPLDGDGRRSLYLTVRRNFLNPMFLAFDFPSPFSTMGRRNVSNVPAQALTLLNDPFVVEQVKLWSEHALEVAKGRPRREVVEALYLTAFGRSPSEQEVAESLAFLEAQGQSYGKGDDPRVWADFCHVLVNVKEFIYVN